MKIFNEKIWNSFTDEMKECIEQIECEAQNDKYLLSSTDDGEEGIPQRLADVVSGFNLNFGAGASKLCIIDKSKDYVIKLPLNYYLNYDGYDCDYSDGMIDTVNIDNIETDICLYNKYKYRSMLAKNYLVGELDVNMYDDYDEVVGKVCIYAQDKCRCALYDMTDYIPMEKFNFSSPESKEGIEKYYHRCCFLLSWMDSVYKVYGKKMADEFFCDFANDENVHLSDMAERNYGYTADGAPIIFDYAGYNRREYLQKA